MFGGKAVQGGVFSGYAWTFGNVPVPELSGVRLESYNKAVLSFGCLIQAEIDNNDQLGSRLLTEIRIQLAMAQPFKE